MHHQLAFWAQIIEGLDSGTLNIEDIRRLAAQLDPDLRQPSRATAYRMVDRWRETVEQVRNPGAGA